MITKTKALVKNSKATRGKGRDGLLMSEQLLIGAYTNPQDVIKAWTLHMTSAVLPKCLWLDPITELDTDQRLHIKLGLVPLHASIRGQSVIFGHWFGNLDTILKSFSPVFLSISSFSSSSLQVHTSCPTLTHWESHNIETP
jgi:hypothetical protein